MYERETRTVACLGCAVDVAPIATEIANPIKAGSLDAGAREALKVVGPESQPKELDVFAGNAGASAKREFERRKNGRERRVRDAHPLLGELILAVSDDPQSTKAWATGAHGEQVLGQRLDRLVERGVHLLHDRRIARTTANIDHLVVCPSGVFVIDAKKYQGRRPSLRVEGGLFRPRVETLMVGSRDSNKLVDGARKQVRLVKSALEEAGFEGIPVHGMLCFIEADWPLFGGAFMIDDVHVLWPKKATEYLVKSGSVDDPTARQIHRRLASLFPPA